jgi:hypothetical protein
MSIKEYAIKKEDFLYLRLRTKNAGKFISYHEQIKKLLADNKPVSTELYYEMMDLILQKDQDEEEYYEKSVEELTKEVVEHFKNHRAKKQYLFSVEKKTNDDIPNEDGTINIVNVTYTFEEMIRIAVMTAIHTFMNIEQSKEYVIPACYNSIIKYVFRDNENISKVITHYTATVVSGYITMKFDKLSDDFKDDDGTEFKHHTEIYNVTHHHTDHFSPFPSHK